MTDRIEGADCQKYEHIPECYDGAFWYCKVCNEELLFMSTKEYTAQKEKWREEIERKVVELFLDFEMKGNRAEHIDVVAIVNDTLSTK